MSGQRFSDMRSAYGETLVRLGRENPDIVVLGADTTDSLKTAEFGRVFPERFFNVGIAEANLISVAAGLAISGKTAFASTYAIFLPGRAVDQIRNAVAYPSRGDKRGLNVKMVVSHGGLSVGADGGSHQQLEDIGILRSIPNIRILIPADSVAVSGLLHHIAGEYGPFYMRMARSKTAIVHDESQEFEAGRGIILRDGSDASIISCGITVQMALEAAKMLEGDKISCRVIDMFSIKPLDEQMVLEAARETGHIITCEEHNIMGGLGSAVAECVSGTSPVPVLRVGVHDSFGESCRDSEIPALLSKHGITSLNIAERVREARKGS